MTKLHNATIIAIVHNCYLPVIGVHGRMHPNYWQTTILLVIDLCSSLAYFVMTQPLPIAGKSPIKILAAKQLPTNIRTYIHTYSTSSHSFSSLSSCYPAQTISNLIILFRVVTQLKLEQGNHPNDYVSMMVVTLLLLSVVTVGIATSSPLCTCTYAYRG